MLHLASSFLEWPWTLLCQISRAEILGSNMKDQVHLHFTCNPSSPMWTQKVPEQFVTFCVFVFVCDGPVNLLTFKPHGLYCSRYCTKREACASDHTWIWHACFSSFWMIKVFTFYLNGELTGYQWFPQDTGSVQESGCIMLREVSGSGP